jgi:hypothetical protein
VRAWGGGDKAALKDLTRLCYHKLRRIAPQHMRREQSGHTFQAPALVKEAFLQLTDWKNVGRRNRAHLDRAQQLRRRTDDADKNA